ncbi:uncharacterized protein LTR77_004370 [Saxophila tyrrhenica]|uniref:N-acetyltransferase domain-containing protein n=1 Tax=Saxophila tyrrhenica TaxID=1690608 RepID=A0AAV9PCY6_9PEZI|nr:hypothetical protein LTR77_004370 [Saxophila tyrrhenica]
MATLLDDIVIREAVTADIDSMTMIIPRAYDADAFLNFIFPDTPTIRDWWTKVYTSAIQSPAYTILVAVEEATVIGVLTLHLYRPENAHLGKRDGICTLVPLTDDHHQELKKALVEQASDRQKILQEQSNLMIDLLGVDRKYQSKGIGGQLVKRAGAVADSESAAIFLQTTQAKAYYLKLALGFEVRGEDDPNAPGGVIVRPSPASSRGSQ